MRLANDIAGFTDQLVADCAIDTASVFFHDRTADEPRLSYLHHVGVSDEAQHVYANKMIYRTDPFSRLMFDGPRKCGSSFIRWNDARLFPAANDAADYRGFLDHHGIAVVGALTRPITSRICLLIGAHRRQGARWDRDVSLELLEQRLSTLSDMVVEHLLEGLLGDAAGRIALRSVLPNAHDPYSAEPDLSHREMEIAGLICRGKQNKEIAYLLNLSEYTVENHLRRIYRKLGIHNRAALVACFSQKAH